MRRALAGLVLTLTACEARAPAPAVTPCAPAPVASAAPPAPTVPPPAAPVAFDAAPWLEDLDALVAALASHYANLDHAVEVRKMDLAQLVKRGRERLKAVGSRSQAERTLRSMLRSFGDGHLDIDWDEERASPAAAKGATGPLCTRLGYAARDLGGVDFTKVAGFSPALDGDGIDIPGGVLRLSGGRTVGVLRIAAFVESDHPGLCENARLDLHLTDDAACDGDCREKLELAIDDRLTAALERRVEGLAKAGAQVIAVDLTSNGGGNDWIDPVLRVLSPVPVPLTGRGVVRHEHSRKQLEDALGSTLADQTAHGDLPGGALARAIASLRAALTEVSTPCDKSPLFEPGGVAPHCTQLVRVPPILAYARPGELAGRDAESLFWPSRYRYHESVNKLPLAVLVDGWTASAAEDFAERVQDLGIGRIVGATTLGSGCGFTNGGIPTTLPRSGGRVRMSDCARFRADGSNAVAGVTPDVPLALLDRDSLTQRAQKVAAGLDGAWRVLRTKAARRP